MYRCPAWFHALADHGHALVWSASVPNATTPAWRNAGALQGRCMWRLLAIGRTLGARQGKPVGIAKALFGADWG